VTTPLPRSEFPVTQRFIYLNHASAGVLPRSSVESIEAFIRTHEEAGVLGTFPYDCRMPEYREKIGAFIGASGTQIATIPNTSWGANTIVLGLDWKHGDEVLLADNEFPANVVPWLAVRDRGATVRFLSSQRERLTPDVLRRELSPRTRAVALSWVSYGDGYRHDLAALAEVAHAAGALLCVDAMQAVGVFPIDVRAAGIDALYAGAAKWMLGLHGIGFLYVSDALAERMQLRAPGWRSVQDMWDFHNYDQGYSSEAMRFESGTPNLLGTLSIVSAIDLFERSGRSAIEAHVLELTDYLCDALGRIGAEILSLRGDAVSSGIVTFQFAGHDSVALGKVLQKEGIVATYRSGGVRLSPHGYNRVEEIDATVETLARATRVAARA
jgi:cysteine desulfurase / selenocysteine lyase